jgi:hypothetical protein
MTGRAPLPESLKVPHPVPRWVLLERQGSRQLLVECERGHRYFTDRFELRYGDGGGCPHCPVERESEQAS